jgi:hypothetical protein
MSNRHTDPRLVMQNKLRPETRSKKGSLRRRQMERRHTEQYPSQDVRCAGMRSDGDLKSKPSRSASDIIDKNASFHTMGLQLLYSISLHVTFTAPYKTTKCATQGYHAHISCPFQHLESESYRHVVPPLQINCTVSLAPQNRHPARRHYRARFASAYRTAFASAAHRAACQACLSLAMPWLVPGNERAWSALSPVIGDVVHGARSL